MIDEAYGYWQSLNAVRSPPARRDIDPTAIPRLLGSIMLTDVLPSPPHFRYRLIGQHIADRLPELSRGMAPLSAKADPRYPPGGDEITIMTAATNLRQPQLFFGRGRIQHRRLPLARLDCPMVEDGTAVAIIFSCLMFGAF
ncbi:MAG TPA: PAS domain-containing protein [Stellaceae bacterium]|nr:PAS domain-containing protein [Stellaceae bacterium]